MNYAVNDHHWKRYLKFIGSRKESVGYVERHHIYPRSMFPQKANDADNIIAITAREHFIAHWMLHKAFGGKMTQAFMYMRAGEQARYWNLNSRSYKQLREEFGRIWSNKRTGKPLTEEHKKAMSLGRTGIPLSKSHKESIRAGNKGKVISQETCKRISEARKGITPNRPMTDSYRALLQRPKERVACNCCGKIVAVNMVNRWHNDNCKQKAFA